MSKQAPSDRKQADGAGLDGWSRGAAQHPQGGEGGRTDNPIGRRSLLAAAGVVSGGLACTSRATVAQARRFGRGAPPVRYPDPDIVSLDKAFDRYKLGNTPIERLYTGTLWAEGPAWNAVGRYLVWSDIPRNRQLRWLDDCGHVSTMRSPSNHSNGNTFDFQGRQISCEHSTRRVVRYEHDGSVTVLAGEYAGKIFNAPNDVVVHPDDGAIWFTDPGYGRHFEYEGKKEDLSQKERVYRIDARTGAVQAVTDEVYKPNGLCFSPDYKKLYISDTGTSHYSKARKQIWQFDVKGARTLGRGRRLASMKMGTKAGQADGIRADRDGNVWSSAGWVGDGYDGVHVFTPQGQRIGMIRLPEICSNLCFGGPRRNRLFMTASQSLYAVYVEARGAHIT